MNHHASGGHFSEVDPQRHLAWFLGPKAENARLLEELVLEAMRDHIYWRRNYYPDDPVVTTRPLQREHGSEHDRLHQYLHEMLAELRRNFPFNSPRYLAHELSDISLPFLAGYVATLLYNPNNVTPEAAPVTVHWEIDACNAVLKMLGFKPAPDPPPKTVDAIDYYHSASASVFGWAHLTSGGTIANIEALWVARTVKLFPLAIQQAAKVEDVAVEIKLPNEVKCDIQQTTEFQLLTLKPGEALHLLGNFVDAVRRKHGLDFHDAHNRAWKVLRCTSRSVTRGVGSAAGGHRLVLLVAGSAHYSIEKAADIVGLGRDNIIRVQVDEHFRMSLDDLNKKLRALITQEVVPLAVVATAGTTEEGAVDPIHGINDLRGTLERECGVSFWLHLDAAWGGYLRCLLHYSVSDEVLQVLDRAAQLASAASLTGTLRERTLQLRRRLHERIAEQHAAAKKVKHPEGAHSEASRDDSLSTYSDEERDHDASLLRSATQAMLACETTSNLEGFLDNIRKLYGGLYLFARRKRELRSLSITLQDRTEILERFTRDTVRVEWRSYKRTREVCWGDRYLTQAFLAFGKADSITIDPHKLGYAPYPCGVVAYRNDRVRHFILQSAPYITASKQNSLVHLPPRHVRLQEGGIGSQDVVIESFAPFVLEGSRPGAVAGGLWLATKSIPLTMRDHGSILRASLLAARSLYEWLATWRQMVDEAGKEDPESCEFDFIPLNDRPDTNIVVFVAKRVLANSLNDMNRLTRAVYDRFSIQAELGDRDYSYSQPFFLSMTTLTSPNYPVDCLKSFFDRVNIKPRQYKHCYESEGLVVLRATVMSPYIHPLQVRSGYDYVRLFVEALGEAAQSCIDRL